MELINKAAVVAEIKRRKEINKYRDTDDSLFEDKAILSFIDTLEVKEVDLENAVGKWLDDNCDDTGYFNQLDFAKHFFELGLKTQKE